MMVVTDKLIAYSLVSEDQGCKSAGFGPAVIYPLPEGTPRLKQTRKLRFRILVILLNMFDYFKLRKKFEFHQMSFF